MAGQFWGSIYITSNTNFDMRKRKGKEKKGEKEQEEEKMARHVASAQHVITRGFTCMHGMPL